ncbi:Phosphate-binding protein PstS2 [Austwickia sp. TVS 96-490-7B]|uniref:phosphate ABC transporter substrate-binding protein PstS n=1 Tax=Austwickia sp. TVS 96-490-7B TaxID=2830843 RepID=UPI001D89FBE3|nr:phosphate ABC transporter substrate-binding protein PstS [Austwickia sp. TVS 96-490-7B]MBW3083874.1 Phosphate-binding protein PstS2 [Austwickia sp. TVS 96-490-7B]
MKTQRRSWAFGVVLVGALALSGCGSDATPAAGTASDTGSGSSATANCFSGNLTGEGSSAQKNAIEVAISQYSRKCADANISYNPSGSGSGIKQFTAGQVDFGGTDSALTTEEKAKADKMCGSEAIDLPMVVGPIAVAFNVKGLPKVALDAPTVAKLLSGRITSWNDPQIATLNPGVDLPSTPVKVFFRSDDSGTTDNLTKYLHAAAPTDWPHAPAKKWTGAVGEGKQGSAGVAQAVKGQDGGIGYLEWSYASQNSLSTAAISTGSGTAVPLTAESAGRAVAAAHQVGEGKDLALKLDYTTKAEGAYPIVLVTYELICSKYTDQAKGAKVKSLMSFMADPLTQQAMQAKGYAPLPSQVREKVASTIAAVS